MVSSVTPSTTSTSNKDNRDLIFLVVLLAIGLTVFELWMATTRHDNSRDQHLGTALVYAHGHIDLMRPVILGFNANGTPTPLEFPIWQAVVAVFMKAFGDWRGWGNITALIFFFSSLWALFELCRREHSARMGWWAVLFSLVQPLSFTSGGQASCDSTAWTFAMWFIYCAYRMMKEGKWRWWFLAAVMGSLSATTKAPYFMTAGLTTFFWLCLRYRTSIRAWAFLASAGLVSMLAFVVWNYHCHKMYKEALFPFWDLNIGDGSIRKWYFGGLADRLDIRRWMKLTWHLYNSVFYGAGFIFAVSLWFRRALDGWVWLLAAVISTMVFPILIVEHRHYLFIYASAVAWLCAKAAVELEPGIWNALKAATVTRALVLLAVFAVTLPGLLMLIRTSSWDTYDQDVGEAIEQHTSPDEKIVVWGQSWGYPFYRAHREGLSGGYGLSDNAWFNDPANVERLKQLGYKKVVLINPSPFMESVLKAQGGTVEEQKDLHKMLPTIAKDWPVTFESPQVLIVQIP